MSQTLSLTPDIYSLYIKPPVAGVDFTGSPTPSVSYQWRKNGTAIAGQDAATITGVGVVQSGSTVTLADGDTISIDIILTNPVQVTTKTVSAVIDASLSAPVISPISIRLLSAPSDPVSTISNASIGSQIMVASTDSVNVVITPPLLPTYQWRRGFAPIAGANSQTYTLQAADADSIIDCVVTATNSGGTTTRTASATVGTLPAAGWTYLAPSADSRLIYVSNDGDDVAAANVHGRGYYLPSDPEIGPDATNPVGPIVAYASPVEATKRFRGRNWNGTNAPGGIPLYTDNNTPNRNGYPDWLLFRRGQSFDMPAVTTAWDSSIVKPPTALMGRWVVERNLFSYEGGGASGRSESEPAVVTAWGSLSESRPIITPFGADFNSRNMALVSIETPTDFQWAGVAGGGSSAGNTADNLLLEDIKAISLGYSNKTILGNARFRRCIVSGAFSPGGHNQGWFHDTYAGGTHTIVVEECVFDKNGYKDDPFDASTWSASVFSLASPGQLPAGTGVQPTRTFKDRNLYLKYYDAMTVRGSIISRGGGGGSAQLRVGGIVERNLFIWNNAAVGMTHPEVDATKHLGSLIANNVVLHDDCFLPDGGWGTGLSAGGASDDVAVIDGNIVTHFHRSNNGGGSIAISGKPDNYVDGVLVNPASKLMKGIIKDNDIHREFEGVGILVLDTVHNYGVLAADVTGNNVSTSGTLFVDGISTIRPGMHSLQGDASKPPEFTYSGNKFHTTVDGGGFEWGWSLNASGDWRNGPFENGTLAQWQAAGYDTDATVTSDFAAFKASAGWTAPERDIVSYMESVDPTYVVDEDVYVDEDAVIKQTNRQKVWEVLSNPASYSGTAWAQTYGLMTEAQAKLAARRFHAFVTFIQRAKENRKGAWDARWTAEAVNNYIRAGYGKAPVTGAYDSRSIADRLLDYTT